MNWNNIPTGSMDCSSAETFVINKTTEEIAEILGLTEENHHDYVKEHEPGRLKYRDNGTWYVWKYEGFDTISVNRGCFCSHDCCGHLCGLSYDLQPEPDGITRIIENRSYNF